MDIRKEVTVDKILGKAIRFAWAVAATLAAIEFVYHYLWR